MKHHVLRLKWWSWITVLSGVMICRATAGESAPAAQGATNSAVRWLPLNDLLKKWGDVPLDEVQRAAEHGDLTARHYLGYCYGEGVRVAANGTKAVEWYRRAGEGGYLPSFNNLGLLYERGKGVPQDDEKATHYYRLAGEGGYVSVMVPLYVRYWDGKGVKADHAEALKWLRRAAEANHAGAQTRLGDWYEHPPFEGEGAARHQPPQNFSEAARWYRRAADQNWAGGQYYLGLLYLNGKGVVQDEEQSVELMRKAADQNLPDALFELALLYARGIGEPRNDQDRPFNLLLRAAVGDSRDSFAALAQRYQEGLGTRRDVVEAAAWRYRAADADLMRFGHNDPLIARAFSEVKPADPFSGALRIFANAAKGDAAALRQIGNLYREGKDVPTDSARARFWFGLADRTAAAPGPMSSNWLKQWDLAAAAAREIVGDLGR